MKDQSTNWVILNSDDVTAEIDPLGAQLSALRDREGRDLLWGGDPAVWNGRAPLLFPIVGALAGGVYRLGADVRPLSRHGFARGRIFDVVESRDDTATFKLRADVATLDIYPFHFELLVRFALNGATLSVAVDVRNEGDAQMPASFGFHPAFRWPLPYGRPRAGHFIEFECDEPTPVRRLDAAGLLTPESHATPIVGRRLVLADELFKDDVIILDQVRSRRVTYGADDGPRLEVSYPDSPYLGIWTKPQAGFICIEPWHGVADPEGFSGDFTAKPGVFSVAAGAAARIEMAITLRP